MSTQKTTQLNLNGVREIDITNSFESDDEIEIIIEDPKEKSETKKSKNPFDAFLNRKKIEKTPQQRLNEFKATINGRLKSKNEVLSSQNQQKPTTKLINLDDDTITPSLHTRAKGVVKTMRQFVPKNLQDEERQFQEGRYEFSKKTKVKDKKTDQDLRQTKLPFVNVDQFKDDKNMPIYKLDGPLYPWRKKTKPEQSNNIFKGIEFTTIKNNGFLYFEREKEERKKEREEQKKRQKEKEEKEKIERVRHLENTFSNLLGLNKYNSEKKPSEDLISKTQSSDEELKNLNILQEIEKDQQKLEGSFDEMNDEWYLQKKRFKYGLDEIVKPYDSAHAFPFVKAILGFKFKQTLDESSKPKRIPDVFTDGEVYKKTFHYLVINECIADLHQRMKKIQKQSSQKILVQIGSMTDTGNGIVELRIKQVRSQSESQNDEKNFLLKNYSMSKNRLGVITNNQFFKLQNYGIHCEKNQNFGHSFNFLCFLKTPESKQQVKDPEVVILSCVDLSELDFVMKLTSSRKAYFYDIEKLSTSIREYMSISNIEYSWLSDHIYNPKFIDSENRELIEQNTRQCIEKLLQVLKSNYNMTQFESIREMVLRQRGIVLLQGPPGTGKTSTLLGLLAAQYAYLKKIGDKRKIMICAPSNAAIDHITKRLRTEGLVNQDGSIIHPNVLRLGIVETEDRDITSCSLDHICESKIVAEKNKTFKESKMTTFQIREELMNLQKKMKFLNADLIKAQRQRKEAVIQKLQMDLKEFNSQKIRLESLLYNFRREKIISKKYYQELEKKLLKDAQILIVTLSSSGGQKMEQVRGDIACLIVDEAAQATEPSLLIALQTGVEKVMLIGDPSQLPATTLSSDSNITLFNRSLFQRFIDSGIQPYFLNIQYRMMPMIRHFPSERFYRGKLVDGQCVINRQMPNVLEGITGERSVIFIDLKGGQEKVQESSFCNFKEANFITKLLKKSNLWSSGISIGVITPYQAQRKLLLKQTSKIQKQKSELMINTIDSFQGQQKDLILMSTVRSNDRKQIGFLMDERRINVSLTRAKFGMIIIGNGDTLGSNQVWHEFLKFIEGNKLYFQVNTNEDEEKVLTNIMKKSFFNQQQIRRRFYQEKELTFDPRKIRVSEISENDLKKRERKNEARTKDQYMEKAQLIEEEIQSSNLNSPDEKTKNDEPSSNEEVRKFVNSEFPMKKGHLQSNENYQYKAEELIRKKRKKEEEAKDYEEACKRLKFVQKEKANDDFYKYLFQ